MGEVSLRVTVVDRRFGSGSGSSWERTLTTMWPPGLGDAVMLAPDTDRDNLGSGESWPVCWRVWDHAGGVRVHLAAIVVDPDEQMRAELEAASDEPALAQGWSVVLERQRPEPVLERGGWRRLPPVTLDDTDPPGPDPDPGQR